MAEAADAAGTVDDAADGVIEALHWSGGDRMSEVVQHFGFGFQQRAAELPYRLDFRHRRPGAPAVEVLRCGCGVLTNQSLDYATHSPLVLLSFCP
jgi:hypothetical protein